MFLQANHAVCLFADFGQGLGRRDGNRKNERLRRARTCSAQGRSGRGACGDSVVDDDRDAVFDVDGQAIAEIAAAPAFDFRELQIANVRRGARIPPKIALAFGPLSLTKACSLSSITP